MFQLVLHSYDSDNDISEQSTLDLFCIIINIL